jgi:hypothetical protein
MCKFTFEFGSKPFVFVYSGAKVVLFIEIDVVICNTNIRKCNL